MENTLRIKFNNQNQFFQIQENGVFVDYNTVNHKLSFLVLFEEIEENFVIQNGPIDVKTNRLYTSIFLNIYLVFYIIILSNDAPNNAKWIFFFLCFIPFIFLLVKNTQKYDEKHLNSKKLLYFIYTNKNSQDVDNFISSIYLKQKEYFRKKYFKLDPIIPFQIQFERYLWLYEKNIINENEYIIILEDLKKHHGLNDNFQ